MRARTHVLLTYLLTSPLLGVNHALPTALSAILPDLDHPNSLVSSILYPIELLTGKNLRLALSRRLKHRGPLHCPWAWGLAAYTLWTTGHPHAALVPLGGCLHCLEDAFTTMGVPIAWKRGEHGRTSVRLSLASVSSEAWDAFLLPLALTATWTLFLLNPTEFYAAHLDRTPHLENAYWTSRALLLRPFLHTTDALDGEALRASRYGRLPHVRAELRYAWGTRTVSGWWTPLGWIRGDDGRWYPPPTLGYVVSSLAYGRATYRVETVRCGSVPRNALVLRVVLAYEGLDPVTLERVTRKAVILGFSVRHVDRTNGRLILEGRMLSAPVLTRLPKPGWSRTTFLLA